MPVNVIYARRRETSLVGQSAGQCFRLSRGRRFDSGKNSKNRELKSIFARIELPAKLLNCFLHSNISHINQTDM